MADTQSRLNDWFLALPEERRVALLNGDRWMLAGAAFEAALASHTGEAEPMPEGWKLVEKKTCYVLLDGDTVVASLAGPDAERYAAIIARNLATPPAATPAAPGEGERAAFIAWLHGTYPTAYPNGEADRLWELGHVSALAWQARAALAHPAPVAAPTFKRWKISDKFRAMQQHPEGQYYDKDEVDAYLAAPAPASEAVAILNIEETSSLKPWPDYTFTPRIVVKSMPAGTYKLYLAPTPGDSADAPVQPLKDHQIAKLVNDLRDVAKAFHDHQSLRERIAYLVLPLAKDAPVQQAPVLDLPEELSKRVMHEIGHAINMAGPNEPDRWARAAWRVIRRHLIDRAALNTAPTAVPGDAG